MWATMIQSDVHCCGLVMDSMAYRYFIRDIVQYSVWIHVTVCIFINVLYFQVFEHLEVQRALLSVSQYLTMKLCPCFFPTVQRSEVACLKAVYINRCKSDKHAFHRVGSTGSTGASRQYYGRIHKDTKVLEWNSIRLQQSVVNERLTFD